VVLAFLGEIHGDTFCDDCGNGICRGVENNTKVPNRGNCLRFFTCIDQRPTPGVCPSGQWFNPEPRRCDNLTNGQCAPSDQFECPPDGIHFFPHEKYCHKFIMCYAGVPILSSCAEGLYFDRELLKCNFPEYAECIHEVCPPTNDPTNITFIGSRVDCEKYFICYSGRPFEVRCAPGVHWNAADEQCDFPENANCTIAPREQPPPPQQPHEIECKYPDAIYFETHPNSCNDYFVCSNGQSTLLRCGSEFVWDSNKEWCDFSENVRCDSGLGEGNAVPILAGKDFVPYGDAE